MDVEIKKTSSLFSRSPQTGVSVVTGFDEQLAGLVKVQADSPMAAIDVTIPVDVLLVAARLVDAQRAAEGDKRYVCAFHGLSGQPEESWQSIYACPTCQRIEKEEQEKAKAERGSPVEAAPREEPL